MSRLWPAALVTSVKMLEVVGGHTVICQLLPNAEPREMAAVAVCCTTRWRAAMCVFRRCRDRSPGLPCDKADDHDEKKLEFGCFP